MVRANMSQAEMAGAQCDGANFSEVNLWFAILRLASLKNANMGKEELGSAKMEHAVLDGANLREADFYFSVDDYSLPQTTSQSSDFRLSGYGAWSFGIKGIYRADTWDVAVSFDQYRADESGGHASSAPEHPALLEFSLTSIGFNFRF